MDCQEPGQGGPRSLPVLPPAAKAGRASAIRSGWPGRSQMDGPAASDSGQARRWEPLLRLQYSHGAPPGPGRPLWRRKEQVRPTTLALKFFMARCSSGTAPVKMVFSSGMPEPGAGQAGAAAAVPTRAGVGGGGRRLGSAQGSPPLPSAGRTAQPTWREGGGEGFGGRLAPPGLTSCVRSDALREAGGESRQGDGVDGPGQVLQRQVVAHFLVQPLVSWGRGGGEREGKGRELAGWGRSPAPPSPRGLLHVAKEAVRERQSRLGRVTLLRLLPHRPPPPRLCRTARLPRSAGAPQCVCAAGGGGVQNPWSAEPVERARPPLSGLRLAGLCSAGRAGALIQKTS